MQFQSSKMEGKGNVKQRNQENAGGCIFELPTASEETLGCCVTQDIPRRPQGALCLGAETAVQRKREQFMLISFHLLSFSDQSSPNSVLLFCLCYLAFQGSFWGDQLLHRSSWVGPGFRSCRGLALTLKTKLR